MDRRIGPADLLRGACQANLGDSRAMTLDDRHGRHGAHKPAAGRLFGVPAVEPRQDHCLVLQQGGLGAAQQGTRVQPLRRVALELGNVLRRRGCRAGALPESAPMPSTMPPGGQSADAGAACVWTGGGLRQDRCRQCDGKGARQEDRSRPGGDLGKGLHPRRYRTEPKDGAPMPGQAQPNPAGSKAGKRQACTPA